MNSLSIVGRFYNSYCFFLLQAMLALLEVQDFELVRLRAQFSPSSKHKFGSLANLPASRWQEFPPEEVKSNHDEIVKLSERIQLLEKHCRDGITQVTRPHLFL